MYLCVLVRLVRGYCISIELNDLIKKSKLYIPGPAHPSEASLVIHNVRYTHD